jgi:hypothetical protein
MTCLFCRDDATLSSSSLDNPNKIPDMHRVNCPTCKREYHVCGTTTRMANPPDLTGFAEMMERIDYCNRTRIRFAIVYGTTQLGVSEHPEAGGDISRNSSTLQRSWRLY